MVTSPPAAAVIYSRISADPEGRQLGVERQEADCRGLAERLGLAVVGVFRDNDTSASTASRKPRPQYDAMVSRVRTGEIAAVLAYSNSRLTRRVREYLDLIDLHNDTGVLFKTVVSGDADLSTADGRAVALTLATWDQAEAERTRERVKRAKAETAVEGRYRGGPRPFGYEKDGTTVRESEAKHIREGMTAVIDGASIASIARAWNDAGSRSTRDNLWKPNSVRKTLTRGRNAGLVEHAGGLAPATWPALVSRERWEAVCAILDDPKRVTNGGGTSEPRWLLSGIGLCSVCGNTVRRSVSHGFPNYRCRTPASCVTRSQPLTDEVVRGVIAARLGRPDLEDLIAPTGVDAGEVADLRRRIRELDARLDGLAASDLSERMIAKRAAHLESELETVQHRLDALNAAQATMGPVFGVLAHADAPAAFLASPVAVQRDVLRTLATVTLVKGKRGRPAGWAPGAPYFDAETVVIDWK